MARIYRKAEFENSVDQAIHRETWQDELLLKDELIELQQQQIQRLTRECESLETEIRWLHFVQKSQDEHLAEQAAERARLQALVDYHTKERPGSRPQKP